MGPRKVKEKKMSSHIMCFRNIKSDQNWTVFLELSSKVVLGGPWHFGKIVEMRRVHLWMGI